MKGCRSKRLKDMKEIRKMDKNDTTIYNKNLIDNYYPNRPDVLKKVCFYDFVSNYDYKTSQCSVMKIH
jgi:hypothetical protein